MTEASMEKYLLDIPHEVLLRLFRHLSKEKLFQISRSCSKLKEVAEDKRLWRDVYIKYEPTDDPANANFAFDELYSGPFPVETIDLSFTSIKPQVLVGTDRVVKVKKLNLTKITAHKVTLKAILTQYQCTELYLNGNSVDPHGRWGIAPEVMSKQTALEVLSLASMKSGSYLFLLRWLTPVLSKYCKNLKTLDLSYNCLDDRDMLLIVKYLPTSLDKLCLVGGFVTPDILTSFFKLLAGKLPNLKELELSFKSIKCPHLLEFKFLETLHVISSDVRDARDLYRYLIKFPALKTVHIGMFRFRFGIYSKTGEQTKLETLRRMLKPHGITIVKTTEDPACKAPMDGNNVWRVSRTI